MKKQHESTSPDLEDLFTNPEPWEPWESKLVFGSIAIAILGLVILAVLIRMFVL